MVYSASNRSEHFGSQSPGTFKFQLSFSRLDVCVKDQYFLFKKNQHKLIFHLSPHHQALLMVCTVLNFSFMTFRTCNCSINILLPVSGWGLTADEHGIHLAGVMYDPILMFCLDENAWERQGLTFIFAVIQALKYGPRSSFCEIDVNLSPNLSVPFNESVFRCTSGYLYWN